jgi:hypothetical protein
MSRYRSAAVLKERLKDTRRWLIQVEPVASLMATLDLFFEELSRHPGGDPIPYPPELTPEEIGRRWANLSCDLYEFLEDFHEYGLWGENDAAYFQHLDKLASERDDFTYLHITNIVSFIPNLMVDKVRLLRSRLRRDLNDLAAKRQSTKSQQRPGTIGPPEAGRERYGTSEGTKPATSQGPQPAEDPSSGGAPDPVEPVRQSSSEGYPGLVVDPRTYSVGRRGNSGMITICTKKSKLI